MRVPITEPKIDWNRFTILRCGWCKLSLYSAKVVFDLKCSISSFPAPDRDRRVERPRRRVTQPSASGLPVPVNGVRAMTPFERKNMLRVITIGIASSVLLVAAFDFLH
jgi:hypothetical protein